MGCGFTAEGWDEGNPYIEFSNGKREYFYHPRGELELMRSWLEVEMAKGNCRRVFLKRTRLLPTLLEGLCC